MKYNYSSVSAAYWIILRDNGFLSLTLSLIDFLVISIIIILTWMLSRAWIYPVHTVFLLTLSNKPPVGPWKHWPGTDVWAKTSVKFNTLLARPLNTLSLYVWFIQTCRVNWLISWIDWALYQLYHSLPPSHTCRWTLTLIHAAEPVMSERSLEMCGFCQITRCMWYMGQNW